MEGDTEWKICLICEKSVQGNRNTLYIRRKEREKLICYSKVQLDDKHTKFANSRQFEVHDACFESYCFWKTAIRNRECYEHSRIEVDTDSASDDDFSYDCCIICGKDSSDECIQKMKKRPKLKASITVTDDLNQIQKLKNIFENRNTSKDKKIFNRLQGISNENLFKIRYHKSCYRTILNEEKLADKEKVKNAFYKVYTIGKYMLENENTKQFSINKIMEDEEILKNQFFKVTLKEFFSDCFVYHANHDGIFLSKNEIIHDAVNLYWENSKDVSIASQKIAKTIEKEIEDIKGNSETYPSPENFFKDFHDFIPPTLLSFLQLIIKDVRHRHSGNDEQYKERRLRKINAICHAIVIAARPSLTSPLLLSIGIFTYKKYGSKELPNLLSNLGFCSSYDEVRLFESSVIMSENEPECIRSYCQFMFDNADHNTETTDGKGTFHTMVGANGITPDTSVSFDYTIDKCYQTLHMSDYDKKGFLELLNYDPPIDSKGLASITAVDIMEKNKIDMKIQVRRSDSFWLVTQYTTNFDYTGWNSFMEDIYINMPYEKSRIISLPMVNNPATDLNTIYTVLSYSKNKCKDFDQKKIFVTFDQSLYIKAREIVANYEKSPTENLNSIIVRLGGFHLLMSFMGCIGHVMSGSGLSTILSKIYAKKTVEKILEGHMYNRSVRAFTLINTALANHLLKDMEKSSFRLSTQEFDFITTSLPLHDDALKERVFDDKFSSIHGKFCSFVDEVEKRGPTAKLWVQLFKMTTLIKQLLESEKSANWKLQIDTIQKMIPFFHVSGHLHYAESAHLYLQDMLNIERDLGPIEFEKFSKNCSLRKSNAFWSGIPIDQTMEHHIRDLKSKTGIIARGITNSVISKWIVTTSVQLEIISALLKHCNIETGTTHQHVDSRPARVERNKKDLQILSDYFENNEPFPTTPILIALDTGLIGDSSINCHQAYENGIELFKKVVGHRFSNLKLKRLSKVLPLSAMMSAIEVEGELITINPNLVFQRILLSNDKAEGLKDYISHELAPFPAAIFDGVGFRKTEKSALYKLFKPVQNYVRLADSHKIIDGGYLLHKVFWRPTDTFQQIFEKYRQFLEKHIPCTVVFDGYPTENSTKSFERSRRALKHHSPDLGFLSDEKEAGVSMEDFLSNSNNKNLLINQLKPIISSMGVEVFQAEEDADLMIVNTAIEKSSEYGSIEIFGEDTDLLILVTQFCESDSNIFLAKPMKRNKNKTIYNVNSFIYPELKKIVAFIHAFSGCDTTSSFFQKGKEKIVKVMLDDENLRLRAEEFYKIGADVDTLWQIASDIVCKLYKQHTVPIHEYNIMRLQCFESLTTDYDIKKLPPTDLALKEHAKRVYLQCQYWCSNILDPKEWGWKTGKNNILQPIFTSADLIPETFLKKFNCSCAKGCVGKRCTCKKLGLKCNIFCKICKGEFCRNCIINTEVDEDDSVDIPENIDLSIMEPDVLMDCTEELEENV